MSNLPLQNLLLQVPFFSSFSPTQINNLSRVGEIRTASAGEVIFHEGDPGRELFLILEGAVRVDGRNPDGQPMFLAQLQKGEIFGELALADGGQRTARVSAVSDCQFFVLSRERFIEQISQSPRLLSEVIASISQKVRATNTQYFEEQLEKHKSQLQAERSRHRAMNRMVSELAREFDQPLDAAQSLLQRLQVQLEEWQDPGSEHLQSSAAEIQHQMARMFMLVQSIKAISPDGLYAPRETVDWAAFWPELEAMYRASSFRSLQLNLQVSPDTAGQPWLGYPAILREILMHLLVNIEQHAYPDTAEGQIDILLERARNNETWGFCLSVTDFGAGIAPEILAEVSEPFFTTRPDEGHKGLGLSIARNLVYTALGGDMEINAMPGAGTNIMLWFPFEAPEMVLQD